MGDRSRSALLITPAFFGYEKDIVAELENQGFSTTFIDERPSNTAFSRAILRVRKNLINRRIEAYYNARLADLSTEVFDLVLVIKAEVVPRWFLEELRRQSPDARFVFYTFDAISNASNCLDVLECFDELWSFDPDDVAERPNFSYLPLFYTADYSALPQSEALRPRRHSLSFVGTLHSERYAFAKELFGDRARTFGFFFVQARWYFAIIKYLTREHWSVPWRDVSFASLERREIAEIFRESDAVLDMQRAGQAGLTMRTFEVLASGSILVTTNASIVREPFYDPARILVVPADISALDSSAVFATLSGLDKPSGPPQGFDAYSLAAWVRAISVPSAGVDAVV
ncbi:glycosyltransferase family protein [Nocardioides cavernaquae]|uniref:Spore protein YkvP/CgeB glycosyl transferase-like domain-containing protein n=1 Tax=Nocardioides cavernaquae TaxID=2321396 RepID=A0A3A5H3S7_9ACTN|nr:hypothetical protein [Nocardioides cavernaquae]RJS45406.1 hypothetical protein D4739_03670 [Nocardioides cavernaquae]